MEKYIEVTGKTEDAAISAGLAQLGLDRDSVSVEILERAKTVSWASAAALPG